MIHARLLVDEPLSGPLNMARDEALLQSCAETGDVTVRFYAWSPATISLGYFQDVGEFESLAAPAGDLQLVRRTTGGGAILHDLEVTYSIVIPLVHPMVAGRPTRLYELAHRAIIEALGPRAGLYGDNGGACGDSSAQRGPFFCFARRHALDVIVKDQNSKKIAGSAQRRTRAALLQHGSIILDNRFDQHPVATWKDIAGPIRFADAVNRISTSLSRQLDAELAEGAWTPAELKSAHDFERQYSGDGWTSRRERRSVNQTDVLQ